MITRRTFLNGTLYGSFVLTGLSSKESWANPKELVFLTEEGTPTFREFWADTVRDFEKQTGVKVRVEYLSIDMGLNRRLGMLLQAGTPPDITQGYMGSDAYIMTTRNLLEPMDDIIQHFEAQMGEKLNDNFRIVKDGADYLVPLWCSAGNMWYRGDLLDAAGITTPPEKWDAFLDAIAKVHSPKIGGTTVGGGKSWCSTSDFLCLVWGNDARVTGRDSSGKLEIVVDNEQNIDRVAEALLFWKKAAAYSIPARDFNCGNLIEAIWSGNAASAPYVGCRQKVESARKKQPFAKDVMPMQFPWNRSRVSMASFEGLCVFRQSPLKAEAKEFAKFLVTGDRYYKMVQRDPLHNLPPFKVAATSDKMLDDPFIKENIGKDVFQIVADVVSRGRTFASEVTPTNVNAGPLYGSLEMAVSLYNVVYGNADPHAEVKRLGTALRTVLQQQPQ
jgi:multiple sugar transport system substrate-binding protein